MLLGLLATASDMKVDQQIWEILKVPQPMGGDYTRSMTLAAVYESSAGKFPSAYGNVALIDCLYLLDYLYDYAENVYAPTLNPL